VISTWCFQKPYIKNISKFRWKNCNNRFVLVKVYMHMLHVRWVPLEVADGGDALHVWRVAANILNMQ
jgi:hypothetical protein